MRSNLIPSTKLSPKALVAIAGVIAIGILVLRFAHAAGSSTISGTSFQDLNRNGIQDAGEPPMPQNSQAGIYLLDSTGQHSVAYTSTDTNGHYSFSGLADGTYIVEYDPGNWWDIWDTWVPTTTGSVFPKETIAVSGSATANFGWRQIVRSTDVSAPITTYTGPNGLKVNSYNDVIPAKEVYDHLMQGSLVGKEAQYTTIDFDIYTNTSVTSTSIGGTGNGNWVPPYAATSSVPYVSWLTNGDNILFHEYGHAWSLYYAYLVQQDDTFSDYLKLRGIYGDPRLGTSHAWNPKEMIAEDYRQLFGDASAQAIAQENIDIPPAASVPGLKEYLMGAFMTGNADTTPPSAPTGLVGRAASQNEIDLTWAASTDNVGVAKYNIYRNGQLVGFTNSPTTSYADFNLSPSTSYEYFVRAVDAAGNVSANSLSVSVTTLTPDTTPPSAPTNLVSPSQTSSSVSLSWAASTDNVGVTGYQIYQLGSSRKSTYVTLVGRSTSTSFTVTGLAKGTSYKFYVVAVDAAGNTSASSNTLSVKTTR